jgi:hypothetical protein
MSVVFLETFLIAGFLVGLIGGLNIGYDRGRRGLSFWGKPPPAPEFLVEKILDGKLYSTRAARRIASHGAQHLYLTASGTFFWVVESCSGAKMEVMAAITARAWVLDKLPGAQARQVLEEWFGEWIELA